MITTTTKQNIMPNRSRTRIPTTAILIGINQDGSVKYTAGNHNNNNIKILKIIKLPKKTTTLGTLNVRTLRKFGKLEELMKKLSRYKWDVIGLSETILTGDGELTTEEGHKQYYCRKEKNYEGVGFMVKKEIKNSFINYTSVSSRIISIRIKASPMNITIIKIYAPTTAYTDEEIEKWYESIDNTIKEIPEIKNSFINYTSVSSRIISIRIKASPMNITIIKIYAPTTAYTDEEIEKWYESIDNTIKEIPKKDLLIIQGDLNAKVRKDAHIE